MIRPRAFCEIPAGLAGVSLRLHGGPHCRPPISRQGSKVDYSGAILAALGLRSGSGADAYLWVEADDDVRGLLRAYPDPAMLREIAGIIRGWKDEEPRALWERLRAERRERGPGEGAEGVAAWAWVLGHQNMHGSGLAPQYDGIDRGDRWSQVPPGAWLSARCSRLADFATPTGREVAAREVAGWAIATGWTRGDGGLYVGPGTPANPAVILGGAASRMDAICASSWPPVAVIPTIPTAAEVAEWLGTPGDLDGVVVFADPPYVGTTGYKHDLPREAVVAYARDFDALGAVVCISEAEPIPELPGWEAVEITGGRKGQKRTFGGTREWLTMNRAPVHRVASQVGLFGGGS